MLLLGRINANSRSLLPIEADIEEKKNKNPFWLSPVH